MSKPDLKEWIDVLSLTVLTVAFAAVVAFTGFEIYMANKEFFDNPEFISFLKLSSALIVLFSLAWTALRSNWFNEKRNKAKKPLFGSWDLPTPPNKEEEEEDSSPTQPPPRLKKPL